MIQLLRHTDNKIAAALGALVLLVGVPGAIMGTGFFREDWSEIERIRHCGPIACPGVELHNRPVMEGLWDIQYGLFNNHPAIIYWLLNLTLAVTAVALFLTLRRFLPRLQSTVVVALWATLPTHTALAHWAAVMHNDLALMLTTLGVLRLTRGGRWGAIALFFSAIAVYESTAPLCVLAIAVQPWLAGKPRDRRFSLQAGLLIVAESATILIAQLNHRPQELVPPTDIFWSNFALATQRRPAYELMCLIAMIGIVFALTRLSLPSFKAAAGRPERMVGIGLIIMVVGSLAFLTSDFDSMFVRLGDRANQTCAIGGAIVWVGVLEMPRRRRLLVPAAAVIVAMGIPLLLQRDADYAYIAHHTPQAVAAIERATPPGQKRIEVLLRTNYRYARVTTSLEQEVRLAAAAADRPIHVTFRDHMGPGVVDVLSNEEPAGGNN